MTRTHLISFIQKKFNPNLSEYLYFVKQVPLETLPPLLIELSYKYYDQLELQKTQEYTDPKASEVKKINKKYQCKNCLSVFDEKYGDPESDIEPYTSFIKLPDNYTCPICDSPKSAFKFINS